MATGSLFSGEEQGFMKFKVESVVLRVEKAVLIFAYER